MSMVVENFKACSMNGCLSKEVFNDIVIMRHILSGAQGNPGSIEFYTSTGERYYYNYEYGNINYEDFIEVFPYGAYEYIYEIWKSFSDNSFPYRIYPGKHSGVYWYLNKECSKVFSEIILEISDSVGDEWHGVCEKIIASMKDRA